MPRREKLVERSGALFRISPAICLSVWRSHRYGNCSAITPVASDISPPLIAAINRPPPGAALRLAPRAAPLRADQSPHRSRTLETRGDRRAQPVVGARRSDGRPFVARRRRRYRKTSRCRRGQTAPDQVRRKTSRRLAPLLLARRATPLDVLHWASNPLAQ